MYSTEHDKDLCKIKNHISTYRKKSAKYICGVGQRYTPHTCTTAKDIYKTN